MTWRVRQAREAFPSFAAEWDRLNHELFNGHPLLDSRFVGPLLEVFADRRELLCIHDCGTGIDGALILRPRGAGRWTSFLPSQAQVGPLLLRQARPLETLFCALPGYAWSIDLLAVDPDFGPDWAGFQAPWRSLPHVNTMSVDLPQDFDTYWRSRPKKLLKNLARYRSRTEDAYKAIHLSLLTEVSTVGEAIDRYASLESAGWKGAAGTAIVSGNTQARFYTEVLQRFADTGQAMVAELRFDDTLAASRLMIRHDDQWIMLKTTYAESLASLAPGRQLLHESLRALATRSAAVVEFYTNASRDQAEWATRLRPIVHHQIYRNRVVADAHTLVTLSHALPGAANTSHVVADNLENLTGVDAFPTAAALPADVTQLLDVTARQSPESTSEWFTNLQDTVFRNDEGIRHYISRYAGRTTAYLPLHHWRQGTVRGISALGNYYTSLFGPAMSETAGPLDLAAIISLAGAEGGSLAHTIRLEPLDPESLGYSALMSSLRSSGWIPFRFFCFGNWYLRVQSDWDQYVAERDSQLRNTLKRKGRKFAASGGTLAIVTSSDSLDAAITAYNTVYANSWKQLEPYPDFVPGLVRWLADKGWLRMGIAKLDGRPIAAQIWIVSHEKASIFKLAYDEANAHSGAGTLLTAKLMQWVIEIDHVREVDFLIGDDAHKHHWMDSRRERWGIIAYNPRTIVGAALLSRELIGRAARALGEAFQGRYFRPR